jgi:hypothetical protein
MVTIDKSNYKNVDSKILIECDIQSSEKCKKQYLKGYRFVMKTRSKHDGKDVCTYCHNKTFGIGKNNGSFKHPKDTTFFESVNTELKAYILGLIAGDGTVSRKRVTLYANAQDKESVELFKQALVLTAFITDDEGCYSVRVNSTKIVRDICHVLRIEPGSKHIMLTMPELDDDLMWHFIRGLIDSDGSVSDPNKGCTSPRCKLTSNSKALLSELKDFCLKYGINSSLGKVDLYFVGVHAQAFMRKIYYCSKYNLPRKYSRFLIWDTWKPGYGSCVRLRKNVASRLI